LVNFSPDRIGGGEEKERNGFLARKNEQLEKRETFLAHLVPYRYYISRTGRLNGWGIVGGQCCESGYRNFWSGRIRI
jgi:hypothetical protein